MILTNNEIYNKTVMLMEAFKDLKEPIPARLNFYIIKNFNVLKNAGRDIEQSRNNIMAYNMSDEEKQKQLDELAMIQQNIDIHMIPLAWITNDIKLTSAQMEAMMFMIEEKEENVNE